MKRPLVITGLFVGVLLAAAICGMRMWGNMETIPPALAKFETHGIRPIFPYSIVPGGTFDALEVAAATRKDPLVREHYADIRIDQLHPVRLTSPMLAYVSFRKGDGIQWTTHPIQIKANELVLTDGKHMVRTRCGNRIETARPKGLAAGLGGNAPPPDDRIFETPEVELAHLPVIAPPFVMPPHPDVDDASIPTRLIALNRTPLGPTRSPSWPPPVFCCESATPQTPPNTPPVRNVPEPQGLMFLTLIGFAVARKAMQR